MCCCCIVEGPPTDIVWNIQGAECDAVPKSRLHESLRPSERAALQPLNLNMGANGNYRRIIAPAAGHVSVVGRLVRRLDMLLFWNAQTYHRAAISIASSLGLKERVNTHYRPRCIPDTLPLAGKSYIRSMSSHRTDPTAPAFQLAEGVNILRSSRWETELLCKCNRAGSKASWFDSRP